MITHGEIENQLSFVEKELVNKILKDSTIIDFASGTEIIHEGQYLKSVPLLLKGLIKVFTRRENKELLLYYVQPLQSCVMSLTSSLKLEKSKVFAVAEVDSTILFIPADKISKWITEYPRLNQLFYTQFELRYLDLMDTVNELLFDKLDERLYKYLKEKVQMTGKNPVAISHQAIASDLGSSREVITRVIKKLEQENKILQMKRGIRCL